MPHALPPLTPTRSRNCGNKATANSSESLFIQEPSSLQEKSVVDIAAELLGDDSKGCLVFVGE
jgi:hypothetical protein